MGRPGSAILLQKFGKNPGQAFSSDVLISVNSRNRDSLANPSRQLAALVDRHAARLVLYARQICSDPEDVVQDAFLEFIEQPSPPENVMAWLFHVVRNRALDRVRTATRRKRKHEEISSRQSTWLLSNADSQLDAETVSESLQQLASDLREIITARIWGELSFEEIGELIGISSSTAHRRYVEGLELLREKLGATCSKQNETNETTNV